MEVAKVKSRTCFASSVCCADAFLDMSAEAQATYFYLCFNADATGQIIGLRRLVRGLGYGEEPTRELFEAGYLLDVDGEAYVRHTWTNNKYDARVFQSMGACQPYAEGRLVFEGEEGKSAYEIAETGADDAATFERRKNDDAATFERRNDDAESTPMVKQCNDNANQPDTTSMGTEHDARGDAHVLEHCLCDQCEKGAMYYRQGARSFIVCERCGEHELIRRPTSKKPRW